MESFIKQGPHFTIPPRAPTRKLQITPPSSTAHCEPFGFSFLETLAVDSCRLPFFCSFRLIWVLSWVLEALYLFSLLYLSFFSLSFCNNYVKSSHNTNFLNSFIQVASFCIPPTLIPGKSGTFFVPSQLSNMTLKQSIIKDLYIHLSTSVYPVR